MIKMEKSKIKGMSSEEYPGGRIDVFIIPISEKIVFNIENAFRDLGFSEEIISELDMHYPSTKGYYFFYGSRVKAHMFFEEDILNLVFDSALSKKEIIEILDKQFEFPNDK